MRFGFRRAYGTRSVGGLPGAEAPGYFRVPLRGSGCVATGAPPGNRRVTPGSPPPRLMFRYESFHPPHHFPSCLLEYWLGLWEFMDLLLRMAEPRLVWGSPRFEVAPRPIAARKWRNLSSYLSLTRSIAESTDSDRQVQGGRCKPSHVCGAGGRSRPATSRLRFICLRRPWAYGRDRNRQPIG